MGRACKIHDNYIETTNGQRSKLYDDALAYTNDKVKAQDIYFTIFTNQYREDVLVPAIQKYRNNISRIFGEEVLETIEGVKPKEVNINNFRAFIAEYEGRNIGRLRTFKYKDGYKIQSAMVMPEFRGQGLGTSVYNSAILQLLSEGQNVYSDDVRSADAERVWQSLVRKGVARTTAEGYIIPANPNSLDNNGEPKLEQVLKYIGEAARENKELSFKQSQDVKNALIGTPNLREAVTNAFLTNGVFTIDKQKLINSGLYSLPEVNNIISSIPLQNEIKSTIEAYLNSEEQYEVPVTVIEEYKSKNISEITSLGTYKNTNPFIQEKQVVELLGGIKDREIFENRLSESNFTELKGRYFNNSDFANSLFNQMKNLSRLKEFKVEDGRLQRKTKSETKQVLEETLLTDVDNSLNQDIVYLQSLTNDIWRNNPKEITTILESIRENAIEYGVDLSNLEDRYTENTQDEILDLLIPFKNLNLQPNDRFMSEFANAYDSFYNTDKSGAVKIENLKTEHRDKNLIYLDTDLSEYELFEKHSLLKVQEGIYQRVNKEDNIDVLINQYTQSLLDGRLSYLLLTNRDSFDKSRDEVQSFVEDRVASLDIPMTQVNSEELQKMVIYKDYFNTDFTFEKSSNRELELQKARNFEGNSEYLATEFVSEFQKQYIRQKQKNSGEFNNFFNHFEVTERGIILKNNDPISREQIKDYLSEESLLNEKFKEDFKQYSILSKQMDFREILDTNEEFVETNDFLRDFYVNNPEAASKIKGQYNTIDENTIVAERNPKFIRTSNGVYEAIDSLQDKIFYKRLPNTNPNYNQYNIERPELGFEPSEYSHLVSKPQNSIRDRKYYSAQELESITEERFSCQQ